MILPDIDAINTTDNLLLTTEGDVLPITNYLDGDGEECAAIDAVAFVGGDEGLWFSGLVDDFESVAIN